MANETWAEAGQRGTAVRSDCWVRYQPTDEGGLQLQLTSKVASMYGEAIRAQAGIVMEALQRENAILTIEDAGALPFMIAARIETAVKRFHPDLNRRALAEMPEHCRYGTTRERFRRSRLYLPGNEPKFFLNAGLHKPDGVILDLEDSVSPSEKDAARIMVRNALRQIDFQGVERMVRINQLPRGFDDLEEIVASNVHLILIPKCEQADQVRQVDQAVQEILAKHEGRRRSVFLMPIIESALGAINAFAIATASPAVVGLTIGLEDYTADIGAERTLEGTESFWARAQVLNAARAAGIQPIDTVFSDINDTEGLRNAVLEAKRLGFEGKGCIHPSQIEIIHEAFAPQPKEIEKATAIVTAFEEAQQRGVSVVSLGRKMIDPPVVKRALRTVDLAVATGKLAPGWKDRT